MQGVRPRLLVVPEFSATGGTRTFFLTIARYYSRTPYEVYVALEDSQIDPEIEKAARECNLTLVARRSLLKPNSLMARFPLHLIAGWLEVRPLVSRLKPDLLVVSVGTPDRWLAVLASGLNLIYFVHSYPDPIPGSWWRKWIKLQVISRMLSCGKTLVTVSHYARRQILAVWTRDGQSASIQVIPNTTRPDMRDRSHDRIAQPAVVSVITMGHVVAYKNPHLWLDVAERVVRGGAAAKVKFSWAGDGPLLEECRSAAKERGLGDLVKFLGPTDDAAQFLETGDIYFQPSAMESHGISVLEAMRFSLPCVVTAVGGLPETVQDGVTGFVVPGNVNALALAIATLVRDAGLRHQLGHAGSKRYAAEYSFPLWESRIRRLHDEMLFGFSKA